MQCELFIVIRPKVHMDIPRRCSKHTMTRLPHSQLVSSRLERRNKQGVVFRINHRDKKVDDRFCCQTRNRG